MKNDLGRVNEAVFEKDQKIEALEMKIALLELEKNKLTAENGRIKAADDAGSKMFQSVVRIQESLEDFECERTKRSPLRPMCQRFSTHDRIRSFGSNNQEPLYQTFIGRFK